MRFFTRDQLHGYATDGQRGQPEDQEPAACLPPGVTIYLSYCHADSEEAEGLRAFLISKGVAVQTGLVLQSYPDSFDAATAEQMRSGICEHTIVLTLLTRESLSSVWLLWQLGVAEGLKRAAAVALVPLDEVVESALYQAFATRYNTLHREESEAIAVSSPAGDMASLADWLKGRQQYMSHAGGQSASARRPELDVHPFHRRGCAGL